MKSLGIAACLGLLWSTSAEAAQRVAVVVAIGDYPALPEGTELVRARDDARALARFLEDKGGYTTVHLFLDAVATREAVRDLLLKTVLPTLKDGDTLLFTFAGHGFGGDFGDPRLLMYDSKVEDADSALDIYALTRDVVRKAPGVSVVLITDAAHAFAVSDVALLGPNAKSFALIQGPLFALSATGPGETIPDGIFLPALLHGLQGAADANKDDDISASELHRYAINQVAQATKGQVHPAEAGSYSPDLVVSRAPGRSLPVPSGGGGDRSPSALLSAGLIGGGVALAGTVGVVGNLRARERCDVGDGQALCHTPEDYDQYRTLRGLTYGSYAVGSLMIASGLGLTFLPLEQGAWMGVRGQF